MQKRMSSRNILKNMAMAVPESSVEKVRRWIPEKKTCSKCLIEGQFLMKFNLTCHEYLTCVSKLYFEEQNILYW